MTSEVPAMMRVMSNLRSIQTGTQRVSAPTQRRPLSIVADDATLTPYGGSIQPSLLTPSPGAPREPGRP